MYVHVFISLVLSLAKPVMSSRFIGTPGANTSESFSRRPFDSSFPPRPIMALKPSFISKPEGLLTLTPTLPQTNFRGRYTFGVFLFEFTPKGAPSTTTAKVIKIDSF